ncbi:EamA family transporter RarD [Aestuariirhabdus sp. Z084]|uniref:EamA family transporter RarD n=1 Tax=Aestuariirhabdus haliotis TaxID=2918751 RepID=UPI00201B3B71|nr:EamA family transporter RarD [Aestuariirhabdus haliotis]MCL6415567.1 EamA family transporter RarD [Aestuariirhabdus haliotis]MCL6419228.1 EamA family transporter RarD [Aestuariirhabdus haliotis]
MPTPSSSPSQKHSESTIGLFFALAAFTFWGLCPIYFKAVSAVPALEVLSHRILWSVLLLAALISVARQWPLTLGILRDRKKLKLLLVSAILIAINWLTFIWAVSNERILDTSLGYFINPLVNVLLGMVFLQERLNRGQTLALLLGLAAVCYQIMVMGSIPLVALILACSFGFYGLVRKKVSVASVPGLAIETLLLLPLCLGYLGYLALNQQSNFSGQTPDTALLLALAGVVTTLPLVWFNSAATRLPLSTIGFIQYLGPSIAFMLAVFLYDEPFNREKLIVFALIWMALVVFSLDAWQQQRRRNL